MTFELNTIVCADAMDFIKALPDKSVDAVITDPPYGTTAIGWDKALDLAAWWEAVERVCKPNTPIVMTCSQPFTSMLVMSNLKHFRHEWIWRKTRASGFLNANKAPLKAHENIVVFSQNTAAYFPQMERGTAYRMISCASAGEYVRDKSVGGYVTENNGTRYPHSVITSKSTNGDHPTQKPLDLMRYLVSTYSQPGDLILDPFAGSGTTLVAAQQLGRNFLGCDITPEYVALAQKQLALPYTVSMFD